MLDAMNHFDAVLSAVGRAYDLPLALEAGICSLEYDGIDIVLEVCEADETLLMSALMGPSRNAKRRDWARFLLARTLEKEGARSHYALAPEEDQIVLVQAMGRDEVSELTFFDRLDAFLQEAVQERDFIRQALSQDGSEEDAAGNDPIDDGTWMRG